MLDPVRAAAARHGPDAAEALRAAGGTPPVVTGLLEQVQIDHTEVDLIVVDVRHRLLIGRAYVTVSIDVASRCIVGRPWSSRWRHRRCCRSGSA
jgi:putative transposase